MKLYNVFLLLIVMCYADSYGQQRVISAQERAARSKAEKIRAERSYESLSPVQKIDSLQRWLFLDISDDVTALGNSETEEPEVSFEEIKEELIAVKEQLDSIGNSITDADRIYTIHLSNKIQEMVECKDCADLRRKFLLLQNAKPPY